MVLHKHGERLYTGLKKVVTEHLEQKVSHLFACQCLNFLTLQRLCTAYVHKYLLLWEKRKNLGKIIPWPDRNDDFFIENAWTTVEGMFQSNS